MSTQRTQWHVLFYAALREHGSPATEALAEVLLSKEPQQGDILLIRRRGAPGGAADAEARTLRHLWRFVEREALIEYKSPSRPPRQGDVIKLLGYGAQIHLLRRQEIGTFANLLLCLATSTMTAALQQELAELQAPVTQVAPGYRLVATCPYRILVVDLSAQVEAEGDEWMSIFVPSTVLSAEARRWLEDHMPAKDAPANEKLEGHDEVLARLLRATPPEDILRAAGVDRLLGSLSPEQRLADLSPEQRLLAMPISALRALSDEYLQTLSEGVRAEIRKRIAQEK